MPHERPLLPDDVFTGPVRYADAIAAGVSRHELAGSFWDAPWRGVRVWAPAAVTPSLRARTASLLLPDAGRSGAVGGWAAACLLGAGEIDGFAPDGRTPLPVPLYPTRRLRRRRGIELRLSRLGHGDIVVAGGVRVTSPLRTTYDLGRWAPSVREAVVALDQAMRCLRVGRAEVEAYAACRPGWRGAPQVREALLLVDARARSPQETRLRLVWVLDAHLPAPLSNHEVRDAHGRLLGLPDLLDPRTGLVGEYDGGQHRALAQHTRDNVREEVFEGQGLTVVRATSLDLGTRDLVRRLVDGQERARRQPRGPWTVRAPREPWLR